MNFRQFITAALLLLAIFNTAMAENCACEADDGSCSASISCSGGCVAFCPSGGCRAMCMSSEGNSSSTALPRRITLRVENGDSKQVASALERAIGKEIEFKPTDAAQKYNFDYKDSPVWDVLEFVSRFGRLKIGGIEYEKLKKLRESMLGNEMLSMCLRDVPVNNVFAHISFLTDMRISVISGDARSRITLSLKQVTLNEIITRISTRAGVKIAVNNYHAREKFIQDRWPPPARKFKEPILAFQHLNIKLSQLGNRGLTAGIFGEWSWLL